MNNDRARAAIEIELAPGNAYPPFIASGKQSFELEKQDGEWKIITHDYEGLTQFEYSTSELIPELTIEQIASEIDKQYSSDQVPLERVDNLGKLRRDAAEHYRHHS